MIAAINVQYGRVETPNYFHILIAALGIIAVVAVVIFAMKRR